ncbi:MAG: hypothetical protein R3B90_03655 [Planctomycetaceae bacterium]
MGFLTVAEVAGAAFVGGLLVTNRLGRPLEFQCTTPVKPNRTQEILYGPTLKPFLFSELIGKTLLERLQVQPDLVIVDQPELLELRPLIKKPVACIAGQQSDLADQTQGMLGRSRLRFHRDHLEDLDDLAGLEKLIGGEADLGEPLERVREALAETLKAAA